MVIDSHLHIGLMGMTEKSLLTYLDEQEIDRCWLLTWEELSPPLPYLYAPLDLGTVKKAWINHPDRIVPFYAPDPGKKDWKEDLQTCLDEGFGGCGELKVGRNWKDSRVRHLLEFLNEKKLPLIFHSEQARIAYDPEGSKLLGPVFRRLINERFNGESARIISSLYRNGFFKRHLKDRLHELPGYLDDLDGLEDALTLYTDVKFIAHGPHFWNHFGNRKVSYHFHETGPVAQKGQIWDLLDRFPNLFCDISGYSAWNALNRDSLLTREFLEKYSHKVLFGTDNFPFRQRQFLENTGLSKQALDNILGKNAQSLAG